MTDRKACLERIATLPAELIEAIVVVIQTAEVQGDYSYDPEKDGSFWSDSVNETLYHLAAEIRNLKK